MQSVVDMSRPAFQTDSTAWYALYVKHQHERKAAALLERKGIEVLLPLQKVVRRWKDRSKALSLPIFPNYLFVHTNLENKWQILNTPGIFFLVESHGKASTIPNEEMESIRRLVTSGAPVQPHSYLEAGDRVQVCAGPLQGVTGILERFKNQYRVIINVEPLQKAVSVEVELSNLQRVQRTPSMPVPLVETCPLPNADRLGCAPTCPSTSKRRMKWY